MSDLSFGPKTQSVITKLSLDIQSLDDAKLSSSLESVDWQDFEDFLDITEELLLSGHALSAKKWLAVHDEKWDLSENFRALLYLGSACTMLGKDHFKEAAETFEKAYSLEPKEIAPLINLIQIYSELNLSLIHI